MRAALSAAWSRPLPPPLTGKAQLPDDSDGAHATPGPPLPCTRERGPGPLPRHTHPAFPTPPARSPCGRPVCSRSRCAVSCASSSALTSVMPCIDSASHSRCRQAESARGTCGAPSDPPACCACTCRPRPHHSGRAVRQQGGTACATATQARFLHRNAGARRTGCGPTEGPMQGS